MGRYILKRLLLMIPVLFLVTLMVFSLIHIAPGDPALMILGEEASPKALENLRHKLGLDQPLSVQYLTWVSKIFRGDLGKSMRDNSDIGRVILQKLPITIELLLLGMLISIIIAIPTGIIAAVKKGTIFDYTSTLVALGGVSMPSFWVGILLVYIFAVKLGIFPPSGYVPFWEDPVQNLKLMILPAFSLGIRMAAVTMRMMRSNLLETLKADYVRTASAKGLAKPVVIVKHAVRNSLISVTTVIGLQLAAFLGGAVITENIFAIPGFGRLIVQAIFNRDFPLIQGTILVMAFLVMIVNLLVDLTYSLLDPRIESGGGRG